MDFIDFHTHKTSQSKNVFSIENKYPNSINFSSPFSIGIHPWYIQDDIVKEELKTLEEKVQYKNCIAIGECGLDKAIKTNIELQKKVFQQQVLLSEKYQKPMIIHCVKAFDEIIEIKKKMNPSRIWILHGFNKNIAIAKSVLKNGMMLSFGKAIITNIKLQEVVKEIPLDRMFLETDDSETAIQKIYQKVAILKNIKMEELQQNNIINLRNISKV